MKKIINFAVMNTQHNVSAANSVAIRLSGVDISFGRKQILSDISLDIRRGDFVAITGPNGGGKTTLLRLILKLLNPTHGRVEYLTTTGEENDDMRIGYLPQKTAIDSRFPITVEDVVRLGLMGSGAPRENQDHLVAEMLKTLELEEKAATSIGLISGGQLQRTLLGRAIIASPEVVVLDEPLSYLDKHFEKKLYAILESMRTQRPETVIILVSHEMTEIAAMANRHIVVDHSLHVCHSATHMVHYDCEECES